MGSVSRSTHRTMRPFENGRIHDDAHGARARRCRALHGAPRRPPGDVGRPGRVRAGQPTGRAAPGSAPRRSGRRPRRPPSRRPRPFEDRGANHQIQPPNELADISGGPTASSARGGACARPCLTDVSAQARSSGGPSAGSSSSVSSSKARSPLPSHGCTPSPGRCRGPDQNWSRLAGKRAGVPHGRSGD